MPQPMVDLPLIMSRNDSASSSCRRLLLQRTRSRSMKCPSQSSKGVPDGESTRAKRLMRLWGSRVQRSTST